MNSSYQRSSSIISFKQKKFEKKNIDPKLEQVMESVEDRDVLETVLLLRKRYVEENEGVFVKPSVSVSDLLCRKKVVVEGFGGLGKTRLCRKFARDWALFKPEIDVFIDAVLLIDLTLVKGEVTMTSMLESIGVTKCEVFLKWCERHKVLWIVDHFDSKDRPYALVNELSWFIVATRSSDEHESTHGLKKLLKKVSSSPRPAKIDNEAKVSMKRLEKSSVLAFVGGECCLAIFFALSQRRKEYFGDRMAVMRTVCLCFNRLGGPWKNIGKMVVVELLGLHFNTGEQLKHVLHLVRQTEFDDIVRIPFALKKLCEIRAQNGAGELSLTQLFCAMMNQTLDEDQVSKDHREQLRSIAFHCLEKDMESFSKSVSCRCRFVCNGMFVSRAAMEFFAAEHVCLSMRHPAKALSKLRLHTPHVFFRCVGNMGGSAMDCLSDWFGDQYEKRETRILIEPLLAVSLAENEKARPFLRNWIMYLPKYSLLRSVGDGTLSSVQFFVEEKAASVNTFDDSGRMNSLMYAASLDRADMVAYMAEIANINLRSRNGGFTALMYACCAGSLDSVRILLANKADVNIVASDTLYTKKLSADTEKLSPDTEELHTEKLSPDTEEPLGDTALVCAARNGHVEIMKMLFEAG